MIIRRTHFLIPFLLQSLANAQNNPFDCHVTTNSLTFDLTNLAGEHKVSRTRSTPPSTMLDELRFDLCEDLKKLDNVADTDQVRCVFYSSAHILNVIQCPSGSRACLTKTNKKGDEKDRIIAVISIAQSSSLNPEHSALTCMSINSIRYSLLFH